MTAEQSKDNLAVRGEDANVTTITLVGWANATVPSFMLRACESASILPLLPHVADNIVPAPACEDGGPIVIFYLPPREVIREAIRAGSAPGDATALWCESTRKLFSLCRKRRAHVTLVSVRAAEDRPAEFLARLACRIGLDFSVFDQEPATPVGELTEEQALSDLLARAALDGSAEARDLLDELNATALSVGGDEVDEPAPLDRANSFIKEQQRIATVLLEDNAALLNELETARTALRDFAEQVSEVRATASEKEALLTRASEDLTNVNAVLLARCERAETECRSLESQLSAVRAELVESTEAISLLVDQVDLQRQEMLRQSDVGQARCERAETECRSLESQLSAVRAELMESTETISLLVDQVDLQRQEMLRQFDVGQAGWNALEERQPSTAEAEIARAGAVESKSAAAMRVLMRVKAKLRALSENFDIGEEEHGLREIEIEHIEGIFDRLVERQRQLRAELGSALTGKRALETKLLFAGGQLEAEKLDRARARWAREGETSPAPSQR